MKPIVYLAQAYSNDPLGAYELAVFWTVQMRSNWIDVFSPILHTHNYHLQLRENALYHNDVEFRMLCNQRLEYENYVDWDINILKRFKPKQLIMLFLPTCFNSNHEFISEGARVEFLWGTAHNIKMMLCYTDTQVYQAIDNLAQKKGG